MEKLIEIKNISKKYGKINVLKNINFSINKLDRIAIVGGNGAGKTTLLNIISNNDKNFSGELITNLKKYEISFQFQSLNYPEELSIYELLEIFDIEKENRKEKIFNDLKNLDLFDHRNKSIRKLSGGQLQKLNLLLTLSTKPKLIFFDEILSGLDQLSIYDIFEFIKKNINGKITTITVSHNPKEIFELCNKVIFLINGEIDKIMNISEFKNIDHIENEMKKYIIYNNEIKYDDLILTKKNYKIFNEKIIEIKKLKKNYGLNKILIGESNNGIDLNIENSSRIAIIGKNGSGKSTLAEIISGVKRKTSGSVMINSKCIDLELSKINKLKYKIKNSIKKNRIDKYNNKILKIENSIKIQKKLNKGSVVGMQFQKQIYPNNLNLRDVIIFYFKANRIKYNNIYIEKLLDSINLLKNINNSTSELSGGQNQKLNILLTIIKQPKILILDELTTGLDLLSKEKLLIFIKNYLDKTGATLIMITHSSEDIEKLADTTYILKNGMIFDKINTKNMKREEIDFILKKI